MGSEIVPVTIAEDEDSISIDITDGDSDRIATTYGPDYATAKRRAECCVAALTLLDDEEEELATEVFLSEVTYKPGIVSARECSGCEDSFTRGERILVISTGDEAWTLCHDCRLAMEGLGAQEIADKGFIPVVTAGPDNK